MINILLNPEQPAYSTAFHITLISCCCTMVGHWVATFNSQQQYYTVGEFFSSAPHQSPYTILLYYYITLLQYTMQVLSSSNSTPLFRVYWALTISHHWGLEHLSGPLLAVGPHGSNVWHHPALHGTLLPRTGRSQRRGRSGTHPALLLLHARPWTTWSH